MKHLITIFAITSIAIYSFAHPQTQKFGQTMKLTKAQQVDSIVTSSEKYKGQQVQVTGQVKRVCPKMGCWLDLEDPKSKKVIRVKVKDGEIVFPESSINKMATVEGKLTKKTLSHKEAINHYRHIAEEFNKPFDPKSVKGPIDLWEIQGQSAVIIQ